MKNIHSALFVLAALIPCAAQADLAYRVEQVEIPVMVADDNQVFASMHKFYVGASYNFSMWDSFTDDTNVHVTGENTSSFDVSTGMRLYDTVRLDLNYSRTRARWSEFSLDGDTGLLSLIFDARIDSLYRVLRTQRVVPYVGVGGGLNWNSSDDVRFDTKITPVAAAMAGVGFELGERFSVDLGYRYMYMFTPKFDVIHDLAPTAHQFRAGFRVNL